MSHAHQRPAVTVEGDPPWSTTAYPPAPPRRGLRRVEGKSTAARNPGLCPVAPADGSDGEGREGGGSGGLGFAPLISPAGGGGDQEPEWVFLCYSGQPDLEGSV
jgi:hypothetical protein